MTSDRLEQLEEQLAAIASRSEEEVRELRRQVGRVSSAIGYFSEGLVAPATSRLLAGVQVKADGYAQRVHREVDGRNMEIDILATGYRRRDRSRRVVAVIEVSNRLTQEEVDRCLAKLGELFDFFPEYRDWEAIGGVAAMNVDATAAARAEKEGLLVIGPSDDVVTLLNAEGFRPRVWRAAEGGARGGRARPKRRR